MISDLAKKLGDKEIRDEFVIDQIRLRIATSIRALRESPARGWTQGDLAQRVGTTQSAISRMENPDYGRLSLNTLMEVSAAFDVPLYVDFMSWPEWLRKMQDNSYISSPAEGFKDSIHVIESASFQQSQIIIFNDIVVSTNDNAKYEFNYNPESDSQRLNA